MNSIKLAKELVKIAKELVVSSDYIYDLEYKKHLAGMQRILLNSSVGQRITVENYKDKLSD